MDSTLTQIIQQLINLVRENEELRAALAKAQAEKKE